MKTLSPLSRLQKIFEKYNVCLISSETDNKEKSKTIERNIKAAGYDFVKIEGFFEDSIAQRKSFFAVIAPSRHENTLSTLKDNMQKLCNNHNLHTMAIFPTGSLHFEDNKLHINGRCFIIEYVSEIADHKITTASMYKLYSSQR